MCAFQCCLCDLSLRHLIRYKEAIDLFQERRKLAQASGDVAAEARARENCARALLEYHKLEEEAPAALYADASLSTSALSTQHLPPPILRLPGGEDGPSGPSCRDTECNQSVDDGRMGAWERGDGGEGGQQEMVQKQRGYVRSSSRHSDGTVQGALVDSQRTRMHVDARVSHGETIEKEGHGARDAGSRPVTGMHRQGGGEGGNHDPGAGGVGKLEDEHKTMSAHITQLFAEPVFVTPFRGHEDQAGTGPGQDRKVTNGEIRKVTNGEKGWGEGERRRLQESSRTQPDENEFTTDIQSAIDNLQSLISASHDDFTTRSGSLSRGSEKGEAVNGGRDRDRQRMEDQEQHTVQAGQGNVMPLPSSAANGVLSSSLVVANTSAIVPDDVERKLFDNSRDDEGRNSESDELDEMVRLLEKSSNNLCSRQATSDVNSTSSAVADSKAARRARRGPRAGGVTEEIGHGSFNLSPGALINVLAVGPDSDSPGYGTLEDQDGARQDSQGRAERRKVQVT